MRKLTLILWVVILPIVTLMSQNNSTDSTSTHSDNTITNSALESGQYDNSAIKQKSKSTDQKIFFGKTMQLLTIKTLFIMSLLLFLLMIAGFAILYLKIKNIEKAKKSPLNNSSGLKKEVSNLKFSLNNAIYNIEKLLGIVTSLKKEIEDIRKTQDKKTTDSVNQSGIKQQTETDTSEIVNETITNTIQEETKSSKQIIYFPSPFGKMKFSGGDEIEEEQPHSIYKVTYDINEGKGELTLNTNANFAKALNSPEMYLEYVCEYINEIKTNTNNINVVSPGSIKKDGEDWTVTEKIKIKFV